MPKSKNAPEQRVKEATEETTDFSGQISHSLDDKNRVIIPQPFREGLGKEFRVVISSRDTLYLMPLSEWRRLQQQLAELEERDPVQGRAVAERMRAYSALVEADRNWRVLIPKDLREKAGLKKQVVSIGQGNKVELMDKEFYEREVAPSLDSDATKRAQRLMGW